MWIFNFWKLCTSVEILFSSVAEWKQKFEAYYFLQFRDLQVLLMNLLILHLQDFFQTLQVLLNVFIWCQGILATADNINTISLSKQQTVFYPATATKAEITTICSSVLLRRASSKRLARSLRLRFWNVSVSTWSCDQTDIHLLIVSLITNKCITPCICKSVKKTKSLPAVTVWSFQTLLPETLSAVHGPSLDLTQEITYHYVSWPAAEWVNTGAQQVFKCLLFTVLACSSCRVASVSLWVVSISINEASWFSFISSIWGPRSQKIT